MEQVVNTFIQYGALGAVAIVSIYNTWVMQKKLFSMIEKMVEVNTLLLATMEKCKKDF
jgi:hypothetical protein